MQVIKQRYWMNPNATLAWRAIGPYCIQDVPYYKLTEHRAGHSGKTGNRYEVYPTSGNTPVAGILLERRKAGDTVRETSRPNNQYITPDFLEDDTVASTIPLNKLRIFKARYHNIDRLLFTPSVHAPNLEYIKLRGNYTTLGNLDLTNNRKLNYLDISINHIDSIALPVTGPSDTDNYFTFAYLGHFEYSMFAPRQVVNALMRRAFYSKVSDATVSGTEIKHFNSDACTGSLYYDGVNYHKLLVDKGWRIDHISTEEDVNFSSSASQTKGLDLMTTKHNWQLVIPAEASSWLSADVYDGGPLNQVQTTNLTATANNTGAPRSVVVALRKLKVDQPTFEFHYSAKITITQP